MPQLNSDGSLRQYIIDKDLARVSYLKNDFDFKFVMKLVRHTNYINRLLKEGLDMEHTFEIK